MLKMLICLLGKLGPKDDGRVAAGNESIIALLYRSTVMYRIKI